MDVYLLYDYCIDSIAMHSVATILITILHVHLGVSSLEYMDVVTALQQACPYTNFCNKNASSYIQDGRQVPCCRECSCLDDCWKRNNCCPDKKHVSNGGERPSEIETCKDTIVKKGFVGLNHDRRRYFVTEICPDTVHDVALKQKCAGTEAETFADLIWVSDLETNKIYTNKFCAECHGIRKYKRWDISTSCVEFVLNNNHTQNIRSYPDSCSLSVTPPNRKAYKNQCLTPDISTCNVTGLWQTEDNVTESLCESHPLMFVKDTVATKIVFRNVFCFKCNSPPEELMEDICAISDVDGTRTFASFTTVLDIYEADEDLIKKRRCEMDEVEDPFKVSGII